jgi:hypothetical protein
MRIYEAAKKKHSTGITTELGPRNNDTNHEILCVWSSINQTCNIIDIARSCNHTGRSSQDRSRLTNDSNKTNSSIHDDGYEV